MVKPHPPASFPKSTSSDRRPQSVYKLTDPRHWLQVNKGGNLLAGIWVIAAAAATALNLGAAQLMERQTQTFFFSIRGPVAPPNDIVILAIDETSLSQGEFYRADSKRYGDFEPIQSWPWKREAYAIVIDKLMQAGARSVSLDVMFSAPSSYGPTDDQQFARVLRQYSDRVVLAAQYNPDLETPQGLFTQLSLPIPQLRDAAGHVASINFYLEPDGRIHRMGEQFLDELLKNSAPEQAEAYRQLAGQTPTFAEASVQAAQRSSSSPGGRTIFFYGPAQTFEHIPFSYVLDPSTWTTYLDSGAYFKDKIVLIGSTATVHQDFHAAPFSKTWLYPQSMAGVEIHANAIASLLQGRTIAEAIPQAPLRGLLVLIGATTAAVVVSRRRQPLMRLVWGGGLAIGWIGIGYVLFTYGYRIVPTALPAGAIVLCGFSQMIVGNIAEQNRRQRLRDTLKQYATSPIVQEIISQQDDLHDLLQERELALSGKVLNRRFKIVKVLGAGGFSETYIAQDLHRPGHPPCVVKQLKLVSDNPETLKIARRLFSTEAETLARLGRHNQIPSLVDTFEENNEFYIVQEFIAGHALSNELLPRIQQPEGKVLTTLVELLDVLEFVHEQGVIHRDLKPSNIIRRDSDRKLVLIDFGIAKEITTQLADLERSTKFTVAVGTPGYMPNEQSAGRPHYNSDLYALGMICIESLTGQPPHQLNHDALTGEVIWRSQAPHASPEFAEILTQMVRYDFTKRYMSVQDLKTAIEQLPSLAIPDSTILTRAFDYPTALLNEDDTGVENTDSESSTVMLPEDWNNNPVA